ncbi:MAG: thiamine pyrophosphate-binding protein [Marivibrio sp.]|uniref:thiamine pyrophosphate-binding protein n=1 Tax=Marivibrio sp. TaxID=2039719 RepID=UPI0032EBE619
MTNQSAKTGGELLAEALAIHGTEIAFGVPGESYLALLDALVGGSIRFITCRQEGGAAMMADAYGKLTGRPGVAMVTRGPGATNAAAGVHIAFQDSTPMILLVGQVARDMRDREAFQEVDYRQMYGALAKWVAEIDDARRIPEYLNRAFHTATSGRPGPVVLALPEDMLSERVAPPPAVDRYAPLEAAPTPAAMADLHRRLAAAERPLALLGGGGWDAESLARVRAFAEAADLPVAASFRCQDYLDNRSACYVGHVGIGINPALAARVKEADLLLVVGARLGESTTAGYTLVEPPRPRQQLIHVYPQAEELNRVYDADLGIVSDVKAFARALGDLAPLDGSRWAAHRAAARADYEAHIEPLPVPGALQMADIVRWLAETLPEDAILANGAGNYTTWVHRFFPYRGWRTQLAPTSGSMGYGAPAAVAAKAVHPDRPVIAFAGDGCFMMHGQELATAAQYGLGILVIVVDNGMYGTIRMHQEREYPTRVSGTDLRNPDFAALAAAYGAHSARVERTEEFFPAFETAMAEAEAGRPALLHLIIDPEALTPVQSLSQIREKALGAA